MPSIVRLSACTLILLSAAKLSSQSASKVPANPQPAPTQQISGDWQGAIGAGNDRLRVVLKIRRGSGGYTATLYSIDQQPDPIPVDTVSLKGAHLRLSIAAIQGTYDGVLQPDGATIRGKWTQPDGTGPLELVRPTPSHRWQIDPSPHKVSFVTVAPQVRLEVLDWGGTGRPLVLLAGLGSTAHDFDDFAPKLTAHYHVYGITRRGFGASSHPDPNNLANYTADRLGDDVLAVLTALKLKNPVIAGHSIAGEELSSIASRDPHRVAGLIYLDAGEDYAFYDRVRGDYDIDLVDLRMQLDRLTGQETAFDELAILKQLEADLPRLEHGIKQEEQDDAGIPYPDSMPPYAPLNAVPPPPSPATAIFRGQQKYTSLPVPILAIFAVPHNFGDDYKDPQKAAAAEAYDVKNAGAIADAFERGVPTAKVVRIQHADHFVFKSNEAEVLSDMISFIDALPQ